jgi:NMD protein affecting ribosome stability and mRNA decay
MEAIKMQKTQNICDFCAIRETSAITIVNNNEVKICPTCNKKWQLEIKVGA